MKTFIIFDALGISDSQHSNQPVLRTLSAWQSTHPNRFDFINLQDIQFCSSHKGLLETTLQHHLEPKLAEADNVLILASDLLNTQSTLLNWQVQLAQHRYHLPIIISYVGHHVVDTDCINQHINWLPQSLQSQITENQVKAAHIPFTMDKIERACKNFSKDKNVYAWTSKTIY